jgi:replicative DNA helicase
MNALTPFVLAGEARVPPSNVEAEQELLGALIARPDALAVVGPILSAEQFTEGLHGTIYEAIRAAVEAGQSPSLAIIRQHLGERNFASDLGGATLGQYLGRVIANAPSAFGAAATARMIRRPLGSAADCGGRRRYRPGCVGRFRADRVSQCEVRRPR